MDDLIALSQGRGAVRAGAVEIVQEEIHAIKLLANLARRARPAVVPGQYHMITRFDLGHPRPHLFNNTGPFVSEDARRRRDGQMPGAGAQIGVADANTNNLDHHLIIVGVTQFKRFNTKIARRFKNNSGFDFHYVPPAIATFRGRRFTRLPKSAPLFNYASYIYVCDIYVCDIYLYTPYSLAASTIALTFSGLASSKNAPLPTIKPPP